METPDSDTKLQNQLIINSSPKKQKWCGHEFLYEFNGFWFTKTYLETTQEMVETFKPLPTDIILASFPKTGTTWLKALLYSITHRSPQDDAVLSLNHPQELIPSLETNLYPRKRAQASVDEFLHEKEGRILSTHAPHQILRDLLNSCDCKIVYITRNPKDTLVSLWHFLQKLEGVGDDPWELEAAVDQFCDGVVPFGPYYDHVLAYREESLARPHKVLFVTYEELKENPRVHVRRLGEFLGCPFGGGDGDEEVEKIVKMCSFEVLSKQEVNKSSELSGSGFPLPYNAFFRRGEVGDHLRYLGDEMIRKIDHLTTLKFYGCGFHYGI
ncbi:cytosolic sulfotransferase 5-like [Salvia miltiorrhiza]|uniref:cytosolic sulfotransferase 5-like n=1 Tax=Salvia miltiorrhiza TaxID=226208 RepID=UPI0025AD1BF1|nr:cytosolic sulfotransferase 5-like [Salvia miltiorrhiza]